MLRNKILKTQSEGVSLLRNLT